MSARDELAGIIRDAYLTPKAGESAWDSQRAADRLIAAGYSKPRTITTAEELDALPEGSVIYLTDMTGVAEKFGEEWVLIGNPIGIRSPQVPLPAGLIYTPKES